MSQGEQRAHPRREVVGRAFWSAGRLEGSCALRNVSASGALIEKPDMQLTIGQRLEITISLGDGDPVSLKATVVRSNAGAVAFRFERVTPALLGALSKAAEAGAGPS
ncbi:MAG TPA: PilZ domain-containing protein [Myxococcota bacterium]|jgi:hypothetical protein